MKKVIATSILTLGLFVPFSEAHAVSGILGCESAGQAGALAGQVTNKFLGKGAEVPVDDEQTNELAAKECILDGLVVALRQAMITTITQNIVDWINSGFDGAPVFVTDLNSFLGEVANNTELDFILGEELGFLCSPFELQVRLALATQRQPFQERISCSLGEVSDNIEGFLSGDFSQGGWPAWFRLHTDISNTPIGAYWEASVELEGRKIAAVEEQRDLLGFGDGFFSQHGCFGSQNKVDSEGNNIDTSTESGCAESGGSWEIITPGTQINSQLTNVLGTGFKQLELADELDEIVNALLAQLTQQLFTSLDGLRGLSSPSSSSSRNNGSYLQNLVNETEGGSVSAARTAVIRDINGAIRVEEEYQTSVNTLILSYQDALNSFESAHQCLLNNGQSTQATTASTTIQTLITPALSQYENELDTSTDTVSELLAIRGDVRTANTVEEINQATDAYDAILSGGLIHTSADIAFLEAELESAQVELEHELQRLRIESGPECFQN